MDHDCAYGWAVYRRIKFHDRVHPLRSVQRQARDVEIKLPKDVLQVRVYADAVGREMVWTSAPQDLEDTYDRTIARLHDELTLSRASGS